MNRKPRLLDYTGGCNEVKYHKIVNQPGTPRKYTATVT